MRKILVLLFISLFCNISFAQVERDSILERIEKVQKENLVLSRGLLPSLNGLSERLDMMQDRFDDWLQELDEEAWTEESLGGLFDGRIEPLASAIGRLNNLLDEFRNNRNKDIELTRKELEGIKERLSNLSLVPSLMVEAQENRGRIMTALQEIREARIEQQKEFEAWRIRFRPFEWIFSWINKIIANILWVIGGLILILLALAGVRLVLAKLFPEIYKAISKAVKFILFIP